MSPKSSSSSSSKQNKGDGERNHFAAGNKAGSLAPGAPWTGAGGRRPGQAWLTRVLEFRCNAAEEGLAAK